MHAAVTMRPELAQVARRMPFDQFGRYHMLREAIDACRMELGKESLSILDVGGFYEENGRPVLPITCFLPADRVTVLDVVDCDLPGYVKGNGTDLQFGEGDFDLVVSADTLEHVPGTQREQFWRELLRVARHGVILLAPFGDPHVEAAEALLFAYIRAELHAEQQQLKEHRDYGLPRLRDWLDFLEQQGYVARAYPTGYLHAWLGMMLIKHMLLRIDPGMEAQHLVDAYYNEAFFPTERRAPAYRYLLAVGKTPGLVAAVDGALGATILPPIEDTASIWNIGLMASLLMLIARQLGQSQDMRRQEISTLERIMADQQITVNHLQAQLAVAHRETRHAQEAAADLADRSRWLESVVASQRAQLEAVRNGRVMRLLNSVLRRA